MYWMYKKNVRSYTFEIREDVYNEVLKQAFRTYFYQRAGFPKQQPYAEAAWVDGASHIGPLQDKNCRYYKAMNDGATEKDLHGGWYDAGDMNKYTAWTSGYIIEMLRMYEESPNVWTDDFNIPESNNGIPDIIDEVKWGMDHLLRLQNEDGSLIALVGLSSASPPSSATEPSKYSDVNTSATRKAASAYAFGAKIFEQLGYACYADTLKQAALAAWTWAEANPDVVWSNSGTGVGAGDPEVNDYSRSVMRLEAAMHLYALTSDVQYRNIFDNNYEEVHLMQWWYAYPYEHYEQEVLLYYTTVPGATQSISNTIKERYSAAIARENNLGAFDNETSAYLSYLDSYVWGSNNIKSMQGLQLYELKKYGANPQREDDALEAAEQYLHYIHGVNPLSYCYLTNMNRFGADNSITQIFHSWFNDGTPWDQAGVSTFGPAPGFLAGGANEEYNIDGCCPNDCGSGGNNALCNNSAAQIAIGQPAMKSYADINDGWPINTWSITENSCGYQVSYIRLLSKFIETRASSLPTGTPEDNCTITALHPNKKSSGLKTFPNPFNNTFTLQTDKECDYEIYSNAGVLLEKGTCFNHCELGESLNSGSYTISVHTNDLQEVIKVVKK